MELKYEDGLRHRRDHIVWLFIGCIVLGMFVWIGVVRSAAEVAAERCRQQYKALLMSQLASVTESIDARQYLNATMMLRTIAAYIEEHQPDDAELLREFRVRVEELVTESDNGTPASANSSKPLGSD